MYKAVIFDLDGTLVDSLEDIADSMNKVLQRNHYPIHDLQAYRFFVGNGIRNLVRLALPDGHRDEETLSQCFEAMMEEYREHCIDKTKPYEGINELLSELLKRNIKIAVLSNKAHEFTKKVVHELFPNIIFEEILGTSPDIPRKPDPYGAKLITDKLQLLPDDFLYVGDTGIDMQTAANIGMFSVGVLWGFRTSEELTQNGAKALIEHPLDLLKFL